MRRLLKVNFKFFFGVLKGFWGQILDSFYFELIGQVRHLNLNDKRDFSFGLRHEEFLKYRFLNLDVSDLTIVCS